MQTIETYLQLAGRAGDLLRSGRVPSGASRTSCFPNGINVSPDGKSLYVASTTGREIRVYDRDPASEALAVPAEAMPVGSGADNIEIDEHGNLWLGAHPKLLRIEAPRRRPKGAVAVAGAEDHARGRGRGDLSRRRQRRSRPRPSAPSAATVCLIGNVFDDGFLDCTMAPHGGAAP